MEQSRPPGDRTEPLAQERRLRRNCTAARPAQRSAAFSKPTEPFDKMPVNARSPSREQLRIDPRSRAPVVSTRPPSAAPCLTAGWRHEAGENPSPSHVHDQAVAEWILWAGGHVVNANDLLGARLHTRPMAFPGVFWLRPGGDGVAPRRTRWLSSGGAASGWRLHVPHRSRDDASRRGRPGTHLEATGA